MFAGFQLGQAIAGFSDVTEAAVRTSNVKAKGLLLGGIAIDLALSAGTAKKGDLIPRTTGSIGGGVLAATVGGVVGKRIGGAIGSFAGPLGYGTGELIGGIAGSLIADQVVRSGIYKIGKAAINGVHNAEHLNIGGNYKDTDYAHTMRQRAAQEMSSSLLNARHFLGQEGNLYHT